VILQQRSEGQITPDGEEGKKNPLDQGHAAGRAGPSLAVRVPSQTGRAEYQTSLSMDRLMREQK